MRLIRKDIIFISFLLLFSGFSFGQYADCNKMLILKDTFYMAKEITGYGNKQEFSGNELEDKYVFEEEENSMWYFIKIPGTGKFTFDIEGEDETNDWDFLLYKYQTKFCKSIDSNKIRPIRTNLSRSWKTGLSIDAKQEYVGAGINENYSKAVDVKEGERYILIVNNSKKEGGNHLLILHLPKKIEKKEKKEQLVTVPKKEIKKEPTIFFKIEVKDKKTREPILCNVSIVGLRKEIIDLKDISKFETHVPKKNYQPLINASAEGYMLTSKEYRVNKHKSGLDADIFLEPIEPGGKVSLSGIQFYGNKSEFLPSSNSSLESLALFMKTNPKLVIEVGGHVNGPGKKNSKKDLELSYSRAYAVKDFLIKSGIKEDRIDYKGYGNSLMLYPNPKSDFQEAANRRVEIKIISN